jgi:hypothetical protein
MINHACMQCIYANKCRCIFIYILISVIHHFGINSLIKNLILNLVLGIGQYLVEEGVEEK